MKMDYKPYFTFQHSHYRAAHVDSAFWNGVVYGLTSTSSLYNPNIYVSYHRPSSTIFDAFAYDAMRIGGDFRTVVSSGSFLLPYGRSTIGSGG